MSEEFKAPSGKKIVINPADFCDVLDLKNAIQKAAIASGLDIPTSLSAELMDQDIDLSGLIKTALTVDSDKDVQECAFKCLTRCTRGGEKITKETFDDIEAREDYYDIVLSCFKVNLTPFFKPLLSKLSPFLDKMSKIGEAENPKSE